MAEGVRPSAESAESALEELEQRELQSTDYSERLQLLIAQANLKGQLALVEAIHRLEERLDAQLDLLIEMTESVAQRDDE